VTWLTPAGALGVAALAGLVRWAVMAQSAAVLALTLVQPLHGLTFALLHLACMRLLARIVPPGLEGTAQALYGTVGIGATRLSRCIGEILYASVPHARKREHARLGEARHWATLRTLHGASAQGHIAIERGLGDP
jgi:PPP family 3-phenylpropionic acid transporter